MDFTPWNSLHVYFAVEIYVFAATRDRLAPFNLGFIFFKLCEKTFDLRVVEEEKLSLLAYQGPSNGLKPVLMPIESEQAGSNREDKEGHHTIIAMFPIHRLCFLLAIGLQLGLCHIFNPFTELVFEVSLSDFLLKTGHFLPFNV